MKETDGKIFDVQAGFRKEMGCTDQVFSMRMIAEKFLAKNQKVFCAFMDLQKALRYLYRDSSACVRINGVYSDWFGIRKGVRQGCVASSWLFNLFMDRCLQTLKDEECGLRMGELTVKCLLYADDQVIFASSAAELQMMVTLMNWALKERGMKVNASKTKVMVFEREENKTVCEIRIEGELIEQVDEFVYLGCIFSRDGRYDKDIERRVNAGNRVNGALHSIVKNQNVSKKARMVIHNTVLVPTLMYGSESWVWQKKHESRINAVEMRSLRSMLVLNRNDRVRNCVIRDKCGMQDDVMTYRIKKGMLRWFGHVERMNEERVTKQIYMADVNGRIGKGRPKKKFIDQIGDILKIGHVKSTLNRRACMRKRRKRNVRIVSNGSRLKTLSFTYPHRKKCNGVRSGEHGGQACGPSLPIQLP
ncbi:unnamed protein product [Parnassius apollo]|uniref:(apollo) hypothetical protein n=1 Tax=Parnassius apollo TaxID=110799 RepID=A0A8S3W9K7_PARAO|nr:unnamed protein product [Parnassius apollo]